MNTKVQEIDEREFEAKVMGCAQPALVGFLSSWSQACGRFEPVLEEVAGVCNGNAKVFRVDMTIPTLEPEALPGVALPLALRRWTPEARHKCQSARNEPY